MKIKIIYLYFYINYMKINSNRAYFSRICANINRRKLEKLPKRSLLKETQDAPTVPAPLSCHAPTQTAHFRAGQELD